MNEQVSFTLRGRNPDVLTCIANLSNDEVFKPPELAGRMLDRVAEAWATDHGGANLWADKSVRFLDRFTKSGVFLREITSRLTLGLAQEIPDLQERVNHILTKQVFGIGITKLTSLLARRSVYCSKVANGARSVPEAYNGGDAVPHPIPGKSELTPSPSVCTQSYLFLRFVSEPAARSAQSCYSTRFFRFLVSLRKITQHALHSTYKWVPIQKWNRTWTDDALYEKYGITKQEQTYIESQVREMILVGEVDA